MARSKSSGEWLQRHVSDPFVKQAQKEGYRSRAAYKLIQLNERDRFLQANTLVVDLGSAPGGWSQVAGRIVGKRGRVVATDILPMDALPNVEFIQGDFTEEAVLAQVLEALGNKKPEVVICDIAPNISGIDSSDQAKSMYLIELALDMVRQTLKSGGTFVVKVFQGVGSEQYLKDVRKSFGKVSIRKPDASRAESREVYFVAKEFKPGAQT
ncbi:MAG: 23S rRNA (uridine(2552)-2'-O)-methyltransferase RlmE [Steroidobacteraceae bacterium]